MFLHMFFMVESVVCHRNPKLLQVSIAFFFKVISSGSFLIKAKAYRFNLILNYDLQIDPVPDW